MPVTETLPAIYVLRVAEVLQDAERELAAFLRAAAEVAGAGGLERAGEAWIQAMHGLECPEENCKRFFRSVTVRAAARLATTSGSGIGSERFRAAGARASGADIRGNC